MFPPPSSRGSTSTARRPAGTPDPRPDRAAPAASAAPQAAATPVPGRTAPGSPGRPRGAALPAAETPPGPMDILARVVADRFQPLASLPPSDDTPQQRWAELKATNIALAEAALAPHLGAVTTFDDCMELHLALERLAAAPDGISEAQYEGLGQAIAKRSDHINLQLRAAERTRARGASTETYLHGTLPLARSSACWRTPAHPPPGVRRICKPWPPRACPRRRCRCGPIPFA